jgi:hypothetical protein
MVSLGPDADQPVRMLQLPPGGASKQVPDPLGAPAWSMMKAGRARAGDAALGALSSAPHQRARPVCLRRSRRTGDRWSTCRSSSEATNPRPHPFNQAPLIHTLGGGRFSVVASDLPILEKAEEQPVRPVTHIVHGQWTIMSNRRPRSPSARLGASIPRSEHGLGGGVAPLFDLTAARPMLSPTSEAHQCSAMRGYLGRPLARRATRHVGR